MAQTGRCPCGSGATYEACCGPVHAGAPAATAEALMRSRFSAFVLGLGPYLLASWHPSTRPAELELDEDVTWRRLQIVDGAAETVEFRASYRTSAGAGLLHERSRFVRENGHWFYLDGEILTG
jgi:SEC-C motif-containing protein